MAGPPTETTKTDNVSTGVDLDAGELVGKEQ